MWCKGAGWCEQVESVATTLSLAEQNHAEELKRVCLEFVSRNLQAVMLSEGYQHMVNSCPQLQVGFAVVLFSLQPNVFSLIGLAACYQKASGSSDSRACHCHQPLPV